MAGFPSIAPRSLDIIVGSRALTPYQWAAELAPGGKVVQYKNAMPWLEGEQFGSVEEFLAKVERVITFQEAETHQPTAATVPKLPAPTETGESTAESGGDGWASAPKRKQKKKGPRIRLTREQLAKAIVERCLQEMKRVFSFTGPPVRISDVYQDFDKNEFTCAALIGAVRDEIHKLKIPSEHGFAAKKSARFWAESSAGKGKNFNFKVQEPDSSKPNGWSAVAQIHVLWE